jgi:hypothetical protein
MFGRVAPRYDLLNHVLSFNIDRLWRKRTVKRLQPILKPSGSRSARPLLRDRDLMLALRAKAQPESWEATSVTLC